MTILRRGGAPARIAPNEFRDAAALYARGFGATGDVVWVGDPINCWQVRLSLSPGDPRLRGRDDEVYETVELQEFVHPDPGHASYPKDSRKLQHLRRHPRTNHLLPGYVAFELDELGVSGLTEMLERGSLLSGRGDYKSNDRFARQRERPSREDNATEPRASSRCGNRDSAPHPQNTICAGRHRASSAR